MGCHISDKKTTQTGMNKDQLEVRKWFPSLIERQHFYKCYHKWQETFLLPADGIYAEQWDPTGSIQTTC